MMLPNKNGSEVLTYTIVIIQFLPINPRKRPSTSVTYFFQTVDVCT